MKSLYVRVFFLFVTLMLPQTLPAAAQDSSSLKEVEFPLGSMTAGRETFIRYGCNACHAVSHDDRLPAAARRADAPVLDPNKKRPDSMIQGILRETYREQGLTPPDYTAEHFAEAIMAPGHSIAPGFNQGSVEDEPASAMVDFSHRMTVREMRDIVAYLMGRDGK